MKDFNLFLIVFIFFGSFVPLWAQELPNGQDRESMLEAVSTSLLAPQPLSSGRVRLNSQQNQTFFYSYRFQPTLEEERDLVVIVPGFGSAHDNIRSWFFAQLFFSLGLNTLVLDSPAEGKFLFYSSQFGVPGIVDADAMDLARGLKAILQDLETKNHRYKNLILSGFSYGALNAFHWYKRDLATREFNFKKTILVNPPVDLEYGARTLDSFLNVSLSKKKQFSAFASIAETLFHSSGQETSESVPSFLKKTSLTVKQAIFLVGFEFRRVVTGAWLSHKARWIGAPLVAGYDDFLTKITFPFFLKKHPENSSYSLHDFLFERSLLNHENLLKSDSSLFIVTNANDFLLKPQDIGWLEGVLGPHRFYHFSRGGHVGNLWWPEMKFVLNSFLAQ